ncbi:MAG: nitroreductase family protein [Elusimicrobiota bacterium]
MDAIECIRTRRSKRQLSRKADFCDVKKEIIENIIDCGRLAPTANNIQPCEFIVVTDIKKLQTISEIVDYNGSFVKDAAFCIIIFAKNVKYYLEDGCAATENILLAVNNFGLSTCWVAGDKKKYTENIMRELNVPCEYKLISIIPVGYSAEKPNIQKRKLNEVLHWEKF